MAEKSKSRRLPSLDDGDDDLDADDVDDDPDGDDYDDPPATAASKGGARGGRRSSGGASASSPPAGGAPQKRKYVRKAPLPVKEVKEKSASRGGGRGGSKGTGGGGSGLKKKAPVVQDDDDDGDMLGTDDDDDEGQAPKKGRKTFHDDDDDDDVDDTPRTMVRALLTLFVVCVAKGAGRWFPNLQMNAKICVFFLFTEHAINHDHDALDNFILPPLPSPGGEVATTIPRSRGKSRGRWRRRGGPRSRRRRRSVLSQRRLGHVFIILVGFVLFPRIFFLRVMQGAEILPLPIDSSHRSFRFVFDNIFFSVG